MQQKRVSRFRFIFRNKQSITKLIAICLAMSTAASHADEKGVKSPLTAPMSGKFYSTYLGGSGVASTELLYVDERWRDSPTQRSPLTLTIES
jgi:hypothetical protein